MKKRYAKPLTPAEMARIPDSEIDFSDIPELDEDFWKRATVVLAEERRSVTLRVKESVIQAFKAKGRGYQTRMNAVLESYVRATSNKRAG